MWTSAHITRLRLLLTTAAGLAVLAPAPVAVAAPCSAIAGAVAYVAVAPSAEAYVEKVTSLLRRNDSTPIAVVWQVVPACRAVEVVAKDSIPGTCAEGACLSGKANVWTQDPKDRLPGTCDLATTGTKIDLAIADVFPQTCPAFSVTPPVGILSSPGPVSPYAFVMSPRATESAISAQEAHFVYRLGQQAEIRPWLNSASIWVLGERDAGQLLLAPRIKLPAARWNGKIAASYNEVFTGLQADPIAGLGLLPTTVIDKRRTEVRTLAFQTIGQHGAFFPDGKQARFDKANVRDGHYPLWGYLHMIVRANPSMPTVPLSPVAARLTDVFLGKAMAGSQDPTLLQVQSGLVPACAMHVSRTSDTTPLVPSQPKDACPCFFETNMPGGKLLCSECPGGIACATGTCRRNYCEVE